MSNIRKCKACRLPAKGHAGPYGLGKCQNVPLGAYNEIGQDKPKEKEVFQPLRNVYNLEKSNEQPDIVNETEYNKENIKTPEAHQECKNNESRNKLGGKSEKSSCQTVMSNYNSEVSSSVQADVIFSDSGNYTSHFLSERIESSLPEDKPDGNFVDCNDNKVESNLDGGLGEASFCFDSKDGDEERKRQASQSDSNVDIRNIILGRSFAICICDDLDCGCEGEVQFANSLQEDMGVVENIYMDPLTDFQEDFQPMLKLSKSGWTGREPNSIKLEWSVVPSSRVTGCSGQVVFTASRVVEMVKGRKELSTVIQGRLELTLHLGPEYGVKGFRSPMKYKVVECNLFMLDKETDLASDEEEDVSGYV